MDWRRNNLAKWCRALLSSSVYISVRHRECNWIRESVCTAALRYLSGSFAPHTLSTTFSSFSTFSSQSFFCCLQYAAEHSHASSDVKYQSHHFVEARRVLQAVSDFYQAAFLVVLLRPDVVQLDGQLLHVRPEVLDRLQPVREITERGGLVRNMPSILVRNMPSIRGGLARKARTMQETSARFKRRWFRLSPLNSRFSGFNQPELVFCSCSFPARWALGRIWHSFGLRIVVKPHERFFPRSGCN